MSMDGFVFIRLNEEANEWCVGMHSPDEYKGGSTNGAKLKRNMIKGVQLRCCLDPRVPRMQAGEAAKTMTNWCNHPKGKRGLAIPSKAIVELSQVLFWFGQRLCQA
jgi:hypothetical protein